MQQKEAYFYPIGEISGVTNQVRVRVPLLELQIGDVQHMADAIGQIFRQANEQRVRRAGSDDNQL